MTIFIFDASYTLGRVRSVDTRRVDIQVNSDEDLRKARVGQLVAISLPGAIEGISYYLTPDFSSLLNVNVWIAAYAQVFFSLGLAQGIMITYASFLKKKSDITNNAFIISSVWVTEAMDVPFGDEGNE